MLATSISVAGRSAGANRWSRRLPKAATERDARSVVGLQGLDRDRLQVEQPLAAQLVNLRYFAGLSIDDAAVALGISTEEARLAQADAIEGARIGCWNSPRTDYIGSWAPFSNTPTQYLISVDGVQKWYGQ